MNNVYFHKQSMLVPISLDGTLSCLQGIRSAKWYKALARDNLGMGWWNAISVRGMKYRSVVHLDFSHFSHTILQRIYSIHQKV